MQQGFSIEQSLKRLMPASLFGRALLILVVPTVLVQLVTAYVFFERHWESVLRQMSASLAGEITLIVKEAEKAPPGIREEVLQQSAALMGIQASVDTGSAAIRHKNLSPVEFTEFQAQLKRRIEHPFTVERTADNDHLLVRVHLKREVLNLLVSIKRLASVTTTVFVLWMSGSALILLLIATLFLRNQIRPIRALAEAAERFGKGQDSPNFRPSGATEVRRAARAFLIMRERIRRQIRARTEMLAGISHDLKTPLTRMRLELELLKDQPAAKELQSDVLEMERMIAEYLDFARGEGGEASEAVNLLEFLNALADKYRRMGKDIAVEAEDVMMEFRPRAMGRAIGNLIDNALRYGVRCHITAAAENEEIRISVEDEGPGIPPEQHDHVFRPFARLDPSRNPATGGVGLGLTIARDIVRAHGGDITLTNLPGRGLSVTVTLPA